MELKRTDKKLLIDALRTNGGGVNSEFYSPLTYKRLMGYGLIQWKPNQEKSKHFALMITLTKLGADIASRLKG